MADAAACPRCRRELPAAGAPCPACTAAKKRSPFTSKAAVQVALFLVCGFTLVSTLVLLRERKEITGSHLQRVQGYLEAHLLGKNRVEDFLSARLEADPGLSGDHECSVFAPFASEVTFVRVLEADYVGRRRAESAFVDADWYDYDLLIELGRKRKEQIYVRAAVTVSHDITQELERFHLYSAPRVGRKPPAPTSDESARAHR